MSEETDSVALCVVTPALLLDLDLGLNPTSDTISVSPASEGNSAVDCKAHLTELAADAKINVPIDDAVDVQNANAFSDTPAAEHKDLSETSDVPSGVIEKKGDTDCYLTAEEDELNQEPSNAKARETSGGNFASDILNKSDSVGDQPSPAMGNQQSHDKETPDAEKPSCCELTKKRQKEKVAAVPKTEETYPALDANILNPRRTDSFSKYDPEELENFEIIDTDDLVRPRLELQVNPLPTTLEEPVGTVEEEEQGKYTVASVNLPEAESAVVHLPVPEQGTSIQERSSREVSPNPNSKGISERYSSSEGYLTPDSDFNIADRPTPKVSDFVYIPKPRKHKKDGRKPVEGSKKKLEFSEEVKNTTESCSVAQPKSEQIPKQKDIETTKCDTEKSDDTLLPETAEVEPPIQLEQVRDQHSAAHPIQESSLKTVAPSVSDDKQLKSTPEGNISDDFLSLSDGDQENEGCQLDCGSEGLRTEKTEVKSVVENVSEQTVNAALVKSATGEIGSSRQNQGQDGASLCTKPKDVEKTSTYETLATTKNNEIGTVPDTNSAPLSLTVPRSGSIDDDAPPIGSRDEHVPPCSPSQMETFAEEDEDCEEEDTSCSHANQSMADFGDIVCKRLSQLLSVNDDVEDGCIHPTPNDGRIEDIADANNAQTHMEKKEDESISETDVPLESGIPTLNRDLASVEHISDQEDAKASAKAVSSFQDNIESQGKLIDEKTTVIKVQEKQNDDKMSFDETEIQQIDERTVIEVKSKQKGDKTIASDNQSERLDRKSVNEVQCKQNDDKTSVNETTRSELSDMTNVQDTRSEHRHKTTCVDATPDTYPDKEEPLSDQQSDEEEEGEETEVEFKHDVDVAEETSTIASAFEDQREVKTYTQHETELSTDEDLPEETSKCEDFVSETAIVTKQTIIKRQNQSSESKISELTDSTRMEEFEPISVTVSSEEIAVEGSKLSSELNSSTQDNKTSEQYRGCDDNTCEDFTNKETYSLSTDTEIETERSLRSSPNLSLDNTRNNEAAPALNRPLDLRSIDGSSPDGSFACQPVEDIKDITPTVEANPELEALPELANAEEDTMVQFHTSGRRSVTWTESDLDISEQRDDLSTDSMYADDEDEETMEILFTKTYTEPIEGAEVFLSCTVVNSAYKNKKPPEEAWLTDEAIEILEGNAADVMSTAFMKAKKEMQDIHVCLRSLRRQMENFNDDIDDVSLPDLDSLSPDYYVRKAVTD